MLQGEIQIRVRYAETDRMGFLHHANYLVYFEQARTELLREQGGSYKRMEDEGYFLVLAKVEVKYRKPAHYDDLLTIRTFVTKTSPVRLEHRYEVIPRGWASGGGRDDDTGLRRSGWKTSGHAGLVVRFEIDYPAGNNHEPIPGNQGAIRAANTHPFCPTNRVHCRPDSGGTADFRGDSTRCPARLHGPRQGVAHRLGDYFGRHGLVRIADYPELAGNALERKDPRLQHEAGPMAEAFELGGGVVPAPRVDRHGRGDSANLQFDHAGKRSDAADDHSQIRSGNHRHRRRSVYGPCEHSSRLGRQRGTDADSQSRWNLSAGTARGTQAGTAGDR